MVVSLAAVFSIVTQRSSPHRDDTKNVTILNVTILKTAARETKVMGTLRSDDGDGYENVT